MSIATKFLKQSAYLWNVAPALTEMGEVTYEEAVSIKCRWEVKQEEYLNSDGSKAVSTVTVMVDRDITPGSMIVLDEGQDINTTDPVASKALKIAAFRKIPSLRANFFVRTVLL